LQTAHLALPEEDGWGSITLLKDARERFRFVFERDCLGIGVGGSIAERAVAQLRMDVVADLPALKRHIDVTDCAQKWWSEEPETDEQVEARLKNLWRRLLDEDAADSCVLVTHSNLIKALIMQFGVIDEDSAGGDSCSSRGPDEFCVDAKDCDEDDDVDAFVPLPPRPPTRSASAPASTTATMATASQERDDDAANWQVVHSGPQALWRLKVDRLQNCGVLGLRCVLEEPKPPEDECEADGWVDLNSFLLPGEGAGGGLAFPGPATMSPRRPLAAGNRRLSGSPRTRSSCLTRSSSSELKRLTAPNG